MPLGESAMAGFVADDCRWEAQAAAQEEEDRNGFIDLPPSEQIARGKMLLGMLQEPSPQEDYRIASLPKEPPVPTQHQSHQHSRSPAPRASVRRPSVSASVFRPPPPTELPPPPPGHTSASQQPPTFERRGVPMASGPPPAQTPAVLATAPAAPPPWGPHQGAGSMTSSSMTLAPMWTSYGAESNFASQQWYSHMPQASESGTGLVASLTSSELNGHALPFEPASSMAAERYQEYRHPSPQAEAMNQQAQNAGRSQLRAEAAAYVPLNVGVQAW